MHSFNDNLNVVGDGPLSVTASVSLLSTSDGGRHTPIIGGHAYRPNHNFGDEENRNFYIGQVDFEEGDTIYPGESRNVNIRFLDVEGLRGFLKAGVTWRIQEGPTLIAMGEVISVKI